MPFEFGKNNAFDEVCFGNPDFYHLRLELLDPEFET